MRGMADAVCPRDPWTAVLALLGLGNGANGAWMLVDAEGWYRRLPAAVPDFGPLNEHFVRDIGAAYVMVGAALVWAALRPALRLPMLSVVALFSMLHVAGHVADLVHGHVGADHWLIDLPGVFLPGIVFGALALWFGLRRRDR